MKKKKHILITGVNRGLGKEMTAFFLKKGWFVYGTTRKDSRVTQNNYHELYLDLTDRESITNVIDYLNNPEIKLDAIIHNAGIAYKDLSYVLTEKETRETFEVNLFGPLMLTKGVLNKFKAQNSGKILLLSSIVAIDPWPFLGVYAASKAAFEKIAFEWSILLRKWNIFTSVIRANPLPTNMGILKSSNKEELDTFSFKSELKWEKIEDAIKVIEEILNDPSPKFSYYTGPFSTQTAEGIISKNRENALTNKYLNLYKEDITI